MNKYRVNPLNCAYVAGVAPPVSGQFAFVSLFNNDNLGRLIAVYDVGRNTILPTASGFFVQNKQVGSSPVSASPVITNQGIPMGQLTTGSVTTLPTLNLANGINETGGFWPHDFPIVVLAQGWSITSYNPTANTGHSVGFWFELVDMADLANLYPAPKLEIPKVITLTLEAE